MSTEENELHEKKKKKILKHVVKLVLGSGDKSDKRNERRLAEYFKLLTKGKYKSVLESIAKDLSNDKITSDQALLKTLAVSALANNLTSQPNAPAKSKDELCGIVDAVLSAHPGKLVPYTRNEIGMASESEAMEAKLLSREIKHIAAGNQKPEGDGDMPKRLQPDPLTPEELSKLHDRFHASFAFDEARLPQNLHYARAQNGSYAVANHTQALSDGQKNFLSGVANAVLKSEGSPDEVYLPFAIGLMLLDGHFDPDARSFYDQVMATIAELKQPASALRGEITYNNDQFEDNFDLKLTVFTAAGQAIESATPSGEKIYIDSLASVGRAMVESYDKRPPHGSGFVQLVLSSYNEATLDGGSGSNGGGRGTAFLDLPPLSSYGGEGNSAIKPENIKAVSAIHTIYQCDQMHLFAVVDRIADLFVASLLPMGGTSPSRKLDDYYWNKDGRISTNGRAARYSATLGVPGGEAPIDVAPNADFNNLLMRVISSIAEADRQQSVSSMFERGGGSVLLTSGEFVRKAIRDLASNCTLYGYSGAIFAAERMGRHLESALDILSMPRVQEIYGVSSPWQVIERIAQSEFGTTVNIVKHRTLAEETRNIMEIIARKPHIWSTSTSRSLFTLSDDDRQGDLDFQETQTLFRASQYFLAVNGVTGDEVRQYSQPTDTTPVPSLPAFGSFGGSTSGAANGAAGGDVADQLKDMITRGETPGVDQIRSMIGM